MIASLALILLAQLLGEALARGAGVPIPGPVIGMGLMFAFLLLRDNARLGLPRVLPKPLTDGTLETTARGLLMNLSLLFVPAGVGVVGRLDLLRAQGAKLALVLVVSTALSLLVTVLVFRAVAALVERRGTDGES
ncbi:holin-like protein [Methylobacterium sp. PvP062]|jgi:holin-like protein|uniref:LrgA family protein n=2 Tax=Methylobacterium radiotolerans TaxID=31998 RepID=B1LSR5_METRJ|nr:MULTISPECIES: CidA/LrgA family protein [Methylobacterium]MCX7334324.1 CidA/LrgA family protein [Hyphomicrobiales bacterium]GAN46714.1 LrgA family protein [Methylobacterium sp. ME121]ACB25367.1 LrgA family protein [Methylobacterium radiotolerans JCM 2831]KIU31648.1 LrgA [Methylobacterium radiotolerans]KTS09812.1 LrgA [Methylobacterium radiotolerans]